jgi:hypothetical protein
MLFHDLNTARNRLPQCEFVFCRAMRGELVPLAIWQA